MRTHMLLSLAVALCAACADEPAQDVATSAEPAWLADRPENAHPYADETLARFGKLVDGEGWGGPAWNVQGTMEAVHEKTGLVFVLVPTGEFSMDSHVDELDRHDGEEQYRIAVAAFLLSKDGCAQSAWDRMAGLRRPSESECASAARAGNMKRFRYGHLGFRPAGDLPE
jgi:formylglycine-generating enzyme required for sulfatase activity